MDHEATGLREVAFAFVLATIAFGATPDARGDEEPRDVPDGPSRSLIIMGTEGDSEHLTQLREAIEAHLSGFNTEIILQPVPSIPSSFPEQADLARSFAAGQNTIAVAWVDENHATFFLMLSDKRTDGRFVERRLPSSREEWLAGCDALASMVHSTLLPALEKPLPRPDDKISDDTAPEAGDRPSEVDQDRDQADDEESPFDDQSLVPIQVETPIQFGIFTSAGYGLDIVNGDGELQHGGRVNAGINFANHFEILLGLDLLFPYEAVGDTEGADIKLRRWPMRIAGGAYLSFGRLDLGLRVGVIIDFLRVEGLDNSEFVPVRESETERTNVGFTSGILLKLELLSWLDFWAEGSVDLMDWAYNFHMNATTDPSTKNIVIKYGGIHANFMFGFSATYNLRAGAKPVP